MAGKCLTQKCRDRQKYSRALKAAAKKGGGRRVSRKKGRRGTWSAGQQSYWDGFAGLRRGKRRSSRRRGRSGLGCGCG